VQHVDYHSTRLNDFSYGQCLRPLSRIHISSHCDDRCDGSQCLENLRSPYVPGVEDQVRSAQRINGVLSKQSMGIRNQSEDSSFFEHSFSQGVDQACPPADSSKSCRDLAFSEHSHNVQCVYSRTFHCQAPVQMRTCHAAGCSDLSQNRSDFHDIAHFRICF
jgi:hypothetical protein